MSDIIISSLSKSFGDKKVLGGLSLRLPQGSAACLMGPSGCGKSTLLNIIMGLIPPDSGTVSGVPKSFGAVFQEDRLCEDFSALANIRMVLRHKSDGEIKNALSELGLEGSLKAPVSELSGGMRRRVCLCRALLFGGEALFLDEPFSGLDEKNRLAAIDFIKRRSGGKTVVIVTHNEEDAARIGGRIIRLRPIGQ